MSQAHIDFAKSVLRHEREAIANLEQNLNAEAFQQAVDIILERVIRGHGRVVVTGMGKARLIGQKISATMASTGTPSFDLHAGEALHGDLGRIFDCDVVIALSNSGKTREVVNLIDPVKTMNCPLIAITGNEDSPLAKHADLVLCIGRVAEACPLGLAPSTSTTTMLALGDALALTVQKARDFKKEDYAKFHPAGELGRKLMKVREMMRTGEQAPKIENSAKVKQAVVMTAQSRAGAVTVVDERGALVGVFTNGDLRRHLALDGDILDKVIGEVMTPDPKKIGPERLASEAFQILKRYEIDELPVVDDNNCPVGLIDVQDFLGWAR